MPDISPSASPFWDPRVHADRRPALLARGRIIAALRAWFAAQDFVEVETGALQVSPGNETHLHAFATTLAAPDGASSQLYLRTSPEFAGKKLLAAGERRIFEFAKVFRNRERGALHHPEFTLLEWYRAGEPYGALMDDCAAILARAAEAAGSRQLTFRGRVSRPVCRAGTAHRRRGFRALRRHRSPGDVFGERAGPRGSRARRAGGGHSRRRRRPLGGYLQPCARGAVEGNLGIGRATILDEYPAVLAALARPAPDRRVAERFELYACGVELANGFGELTDAAEQRRRLEREMAEKERIYGERYPIDEDFLAALAAMPQASGVALGLDRLVMLATGAARIDQVLWTPLA